MAVEMLSTVIVQAKAQQVTNVLACACVIVTCVKTSLISQLPSGLWNCSVPQWTGFKPHVHCNYKTECVGAEDETDCPYTGHCPPGYISADGRCYIYVNPRGAISWLEANILCAARYGGYLASFNTREEWSGVTAALSLARSHLEFFVGLRTADPGKPHMYRMQMEWADGSTAIYIRHHLEELGDLMACGKLLPSQGRVLVCDHRADCLDSSDEELCVFTPCKAEEQIQCGSIGQCIPRQKMCDGPEDCADGSDERNCARERMDLIPQDPPPALVYTRWQNWFGPTINTFVVMPHKGRSCPEGFFQCVEDDYCLEVQFRCNGVRDCPGGEDEARCGEYSCPGMYRCRGSRVCYRANKLCDGRGDCPQHDDELFCDLQCPANCTCYGLAFTCPRVFPVTHFPLLRYLDAGDSGLTAGHVNHSGLLIHLSLARCGLLHLGNLTLPNLRSLDLSGNHFSAVNLGEVSRLQNLKELVLADNPLASNLLTEKGSSLTLRYLDLSHVRLSSLTVRTQLPFLQFLNLSFTGLDELHGTGFQSLSGLRVIDLRGCPLTQFPRHMFQDLQQLRTIYADSYKLCCQGTLPLGFNLKNCHAPEDTVSSCDRLLKYDTHSVLVAVIAAVSIIGNALGFIVFVLQKTASKSPLTFFLLHLCASDFVSGIYLAVIGVADRLYRGTYLWEDVAWRQSVTCQTAGVLFTLSCQVSGLLVFIATVEHVVFLSLKRSGFSSRPLALHVATCGVWVLGLVTALAPLLSSRWSNVPDTAICIPLMSSQQDNSLVDLLVIPQCTLHALVMAAQVYIFLKTRPHPLVVLGADNTPSQLSNARRFIPVAIASCLCRMSLLVLAVSLYQGSIKSNPVRVAASVIVLPLSSALHPVLYALGAVQERRQSARNERLLKYLMAKRRAKVLNVK
ncbi:G-protein coupled receptor GRL101-like [Littorina saxatilis]|uniref:G-protein coupled receptor GRL101-like n=1 Tax=Littorina saxatilis TaxID=31220 RepID=UPI0038B43363